MIRKFLVLTLIGISLITLQGSSCRGLVKPNPTQSEIDRVHADAKRIGDAVTMIETILNQAGGFIDATPLSVAEKNDFSCLVVKANGTSAPQPRLLQICGPSTPQGPGPVPAALDHIKTVTTEVGLQTTVREVTSLIQPLLTKMQMSPNATIKALGVGLGAAMGILTAFLNGGF